MDFNHIQKTIKKLTVTFSVTLFIVILLLGFTFFSIKYYKILGIEKLGFSNLIELIDK
jgi:Cu/Ag efflux pump CusA